MNKLKGSILTSNGWVDGEIEFDARIIRVAGEAVAEPRAPFVIPGFVDLHIHGGHGHDMMQGADAIRGAAEFHARHGTTSILATSVTAPISEIDAFMVAVNGVAMEAPKGRARVLGAHLEGPFVNPDKLGAQPPFAIRASLDLVKSWMALGPVRVMTIAPEIDQEQVIDYLMGEGVRVQIGHSLCDYARAVLVLQKGGGVTHLFNAMSGVAHRGNGIAGAALAHADFCEIIPDLVHVEKGAILGARRAIPNLYGVTDATAGAGMPDGKFHLGNYEVTKSGDRMTLEDGTLAGSILTMDQALRNLVAIGLPLAEASMRLSTIPANWLDAKDIGRLETGACADVLVLDETLEIAQVFVDGEVI